MSPNPANHGFGAPGRPAAPTAEPPCCDAQSLAVLELGLVLEVVAGLAASEMGAG